MAFTIDGTANMGMLNVINLNANTITSGILRDQTGRNYWDLDTGILHIGDTSEYDELSSEIANITDSLAVLETTEYGVIIDGSTSISGGVVETDSVVANGAMQIGNHVWLARSNGTNTTLVYVGD